jgi:hypothetical protein
VKDLTPMELAHRLAQVPPADVPALRLFLEIQALEQNGGLDVAYLLAHRQEIEVAVSQLAAQVRAAGRIARKCRHLRPVPSRYVPVGI